MIVVHYLDGHQMAVEADSWQTEAGLLRVGGWTTPLTHVRGWETVDKPEPAESPE